MSYNSLDQLRYSLDHLRYDNRNHMMYHHGRELSDREILETIYRLIGEQSTRIQELENMVIDTNTGIDEILLSLADLTGNKEDDEKVCRCPKAGCQGCVSPGDAADSGEPSSSREDEC
jgi:hypothetical protein